MSRCSGEFEPNWHHKLLCHEFEKIFYGKQRRLLITIGPRTLKSIIASVLFPAWAIGKNPKLQIVCASYSMVLAGDLAKKCRDVMRDPAYQRIFPGARLHQERLAADNFGTGAGGGRRAVSVGGTFTGLGGDHIICDDLMNASDAPSEAARENAGAWMQSVMRSRVNSPLFGSISIIAQRLHQDDPIGRVLETDGALWNLIDIPAIAETRQVFDLGRKEIYVREPDELLEPNRMPQTYLDEIKRAIGTAAFNAQYQQRPVPPQGNMVLREWFQDYHFHPSECIPGLVIFQSWDLAMKAGEEHDYSVCITFGVAGGDYKRGDIYIMNVFRDKLIYPDLKKKIVAMANDWRPRQVIIEDKGSGTGLIQDLKREGVVRPIAYMPVVDKVARLSVQSAKIEQGRVFLPLRLDWAQVFLAEILSFPNCKNDDQVDALTQGLHHLDEKAKRTFTVQPY